MRSKTRPCIWSVGPLRARWLAVISRYPTQFRRIRMRLSKIEIRDPKIPLQARARGPQRTAVRAPASPNELNWFLNARAFRPSKIVGLERFARAEGPSERAGAPKGCGRASDVLRIKIRVAGADGPRTRTSHARQETRFVLSLRWSVRVSGGRKEKREGEITRF